MLNHRFVGLRFVVMRGLPQEIIWYVDIPVEFMNEDLSLLVRRLVPTKVINDDYMQEYI